MDLNLNEKFNIVALKQDDKVKFAIDKIYEHKWTLGLGLLGLTAISKPFPIDISILNKLTEIINAPLSTVNRFNSTFGFNLNSWYLIGGILIFIGSKLLTDKICKDETLQKLFKDKLSKPLLIGGIIGVITIALS